MVLRLRDSNTVKGRSGIIEANVVQISENSSRADLKYDSVDILASGGGCAIEIAVAGLHQWRIRLIAVGVVEAMEESCRTRGRDFEDCTEIRIVSPLQGCAIEVSIVPQN
jgi:hypothetical protein